MFPNTIVVGGGIGGLATAVCLARWGAAVTVLEQAPEITEVGAGLQISPNGLAALRRMGLAEALELRAVKARCVILEDYRDGRSVARLDLRRAAGGGFHFVHRADLVRLLREAALQNNVSFELGARVVDVVPGALPQVRLADANSRKAELVVCADGLNSVGRAVLNGERGASFTGQVAWRALVDTKGEVAPDVHVSMGPGRHIVRYPLRGGRLMNLVAVEERSDWAAEGWNHREDPDNLRRAFAGFGGAAADLLERVQRVHLWGLFRHPVADVWEKDNVMLVGDAAHPTLPFLAQGANMALEDAVALVDTLVAGGGAEDAYRNARHARASRIVEAASRNAARYHMSPGPRRWIAHRGLSLLSAVAPGLMTRPFEWIYRHDPPAPKRPDRVSAR